MKGASGGFTIIEVMIVLAISAVMLVSASAVFSGRRESTDFSQAMYDLQSQIQSIANSVSSQAVSGLQQYTCAPALINGIMRPVLTPGSATGQDCIFLGQALQVTPGNPTVSAYPIFGLRTVYSGNTDTGIAPSVLSDAHPEPAVSSTDPTDPNNLLLINTYTMLNGLNTVSAKLSGTESDILTFYSSLQDNNTSGNEISVSALVYSGSASDSKTQIKQCIEANGCPASGSPVVSSNWNLCVGDGTRQAQLSIKGTATGVVSDLDMEGCS